MSEYTTPKSVWINVDANISAILQEIEVQNSTNENLTKAALERIAQCPDPRLKEVIRTSSVISMHLRER